MSVEGRAIAPQLCGHGFSRDGRRADSAAPELVRSTIEKAWSPKSVPMPQARSVSAAPTGSMRAAPDRSPSQNRSAAPGPPQATLQQQPHLDQHVIGGDEGSPAARIPAGRSC